MKMPRGHINVMRRLRLALATATGLVVLLGGAALPASAAVPTDDFRDVRSSGTFVPGTGEKTASIGFTVVNPLGTVAATPVTTTVSAEIIPPGRSSKAVTITYTAPTPPAAGAALPTSAAGTGTFTITKDDPIGMWALKLTVSRGGTPGTTAIYDVPVTAENAITGATVSPNPVSLQKGKEVRVSVSVTVKEATTVSAQLVSDDTSEYYDLGNLTHEGNGLYSGETFFSDDSAPGGWKLEITATRGETSFKGTGGFRVDAATGGSSAKTKSKTRVTITAPAKAKAGATIKVSGKVYKGSAAYSGKTVEIYFKSKAKGAKYKLVGFAKTTSSGKYTKSAKQKVDGYWRVKVPGTSKTYSSLSAQKFVDVK